MGTKVLQDQDRIALLEAHKEYAGYFRCDRLHKAKNVRKVGAGGNIKADQYSVDCSQGTLFLQRDAEVRWEEQVDGLETTAVLIPAYWLGKKAWILRRTYTFDGLVENEDILQYEEGKKLWLAHYRHFG